MSLDLIENMMQTVLKESPSGRAGGAIYYHCPFAHETHSGGYDSKPSFNWYEKEKPLFNCYTCGVRGDISEFSKLITVYRPDAAAVEELRTLERLDKYSIKEAPATAEPLKPLSAIYHSVFDDIENSAGLEYNLSRGISLETSKKLEMCYDNYHSRVVTPIKDNKNQLLGFCGRSVNPEFAKTHYYMRVAVGMALLGSQFVSELPLCLVEGTYDYANIYEIGGGDVVTPLAIFGASLSAYQEKLLNEFNKPVYLMLDNDPAGKKALKGSKFRDGSTNVEGIISRLSKNLPVYTVKYPENIKDPGELTREQFFDMIEESEKL